LYHTVVIPDLHAPYHDPKVWGTILAAIRKIKPRHVVIIGDFADCYAVSSFPKNPQRQQSLKYELSGAQRELKNLIRVADCEIDYLEGNHEVRLERYLCQRAPELYGLISVKSLMLDGTRDVGWTPYRKHLKIGKVIYMHDCGHAGVYAGRHTLAAVGHNVVFGHTHRGGIVTDGTVDGERHFSLNVGWAGNINEADYMYQVKMKDWIHGFGLITTDESTGLVYPTFVPVMRGKAVVLGHEVSYRDLK
jgi:hypothetical protein